MRLKQVLSALGKAACYALLFIGVQFFVSYAAILLVGVQSGLTLASGGGTPDAGALAEQIMDAVLSNTALLTLISNALTLLLLVPIFLAQKKSYAREISLFPLAPGAIWPLAAGAMALAAALACVLSSLLFGVLHGQLLWIAYAFVMGVALTIVFERTGTLWANIIVHITFNLAGSYLVQYLPGSVFILVLGLAGMAAAWNWLTHIYPRV